MSNLFWLVGQFLRSILWCSVVAERKDLFLFRPSKISGYRRRIEAAVLADPSLILDEISESACGILMPFCIGTDAQGGSRKVLEGGQRSVCVISFKIALLRCCVAFFWAAMKLIYLYIKVENCFWIHRLDKDFAVGFFSSLFHRRRPLSGLHGWTYGVSNQWT